MGVRSVHSQITVGGIDLGNYGNINIIGENQQIIFTEWMGRSPQDIEDQITYPLTAALMGLAVAAPRAVRSWSC